MYIVLEVQTNNDNTIGTLVNTYEDRNAAESKYHQVLMSAAISELPFHYAFLLTNEGYTLKSEGYDHQLEDEEEYPE